MKPPIRKKKMDEKSEDHIMQEGALDFDGDAGSQFWNLGRHGDTIQVTTCSQGLGMAQMTNSKQARTIYSMCKQSEKGRVKIGTDNSTHTHAIASAIKLVAHGSCARTHDLLFEWLETCVQAIVEFFQICTATAGKFDTESHANNPSKSSTSTYSLYTWTIAYNLM